MMGWSVVRTGNRAARNAFERHAGLAAGGYPDLPVILVTGHGDVATAVRALHDGAFDFITKPFAADHLAATVARALATRALVLENRRLRAEIAAGTDDEGPLIDGSAPARRLRATIRQLAAADLDVLIEGETGTGKETAAVLLHRQGQRRAQPFVTVNCGALSDGGEAELFGHAADSVPRRSATPASAPMSTSVPRSFR